MDNVRCSICGGSGVIYTSTFFTVLRPRGAIQHWHYRCMKCKGAGVVAKSVQMAEEPSCKLVVDNGFAVTSVVARA